MDESRQCTAKSKQSQQRCKRAALVGGMVCKVHGGAAPQVKERARQRLLEMVDPALIELRRIALSGEQDAVRLRAIEAVLDRSLGKASDTVDVNVKGEVAHNHVIDFAAVQHELQQILGDGATTSDNDPDQPMDSTGADA